MELNNIHKKIEYLSELIKTIPNVVFLNNALVIESENATSKVISNELQKLDIASENSGNNIILIQINNIENDYAVYFDIEDFLNRIKENYNLLLASFNKSIAILNYKTGYLLFDVSSKTTVLTNQELNTYLVTNTLAYLNFHNYFISINFAEYYNYAINEVVFFSNTKGIYHLKIPRTAILLNESIDFSVSIKSTLIDLENKEYNLLFKDQLFDFVKSKTDNGFVEVINKLESINSETNRNYQIVLKKFSFDTLKNELQTKKEEYFTSTREILSKVFSQVVTIPVSIGASVFATYKIDNSFTLSLILFSFLAYSIFVIHILCVYFKELQYLKKDIDRQLLFIKNNSGLPTDDIKEGEYVINSRIKIAKRTVQLFISIILLLTLAFTIFISIQIFHTFYIAICIFTMQILIQIFIAYLSLLFK